MKIIFDGENLPSESLLKKMKEAAGYCLKYENVKNKNLEISVTFASEDEIKDINAQFRNVDSVTDVLSFPQYEIPEDIPKEGVAVLGDVVICEDRAKQQAEEFGHSYERELIYLFVHSMFHLLGYDHMEEDEKVVMREAEEEVMREMSIVRI